MINEEAVVDIESSVGGGERSADSSWSTEEVTYTMDFKRSSSCPAENEGRLGATPPPAQFLDVDEFKFDDFKFSSDDNFCLSGKFILKDEEADGNTVCSEPPKPSATAYTRTYNNRKVSAAANSPTSVREHECMERIPEDEENANYNLSLREDYAVDKRKTSDMTDVISNMEHGDGDSPMAKCNNNSGVSRNPNLVVMGSLDKHMATARNRQNQQQQQQQLPPKKSPPLSTFRRLFACGAPEVACGIHDFKANVKQKGVDTVEEVKGSFGDLGLTVRQVFSPVQNTKTVVKKKVKKFKGEEVDDENTDDDGATDDDDNVTDDGDDESETGSSFVGSESECESEYSSTDDASEGSRCEEVTSWQ